MGEQQPGPTRRVQAHRAKRRNAADEAVHQRRNTLLSTGEIGAGQRRHFEAAKPAQGFQRHAAMPGMQPHGALDDLFLVSHPGTSKPVPGPTRVSGERGNNTAARALALLVLPIPISPPMNSCTPFAAALDAAPPAASA